MSFEAPVAAAINVIPPRPSCRAAAPISNRRARSSNTSLSLWLHALTWCWYLDTHPTGGTWIARPWYPHKSKPSFLDALAALRRALWSQRITALSAPAAEDTKITDVLLARSPTRHEQTPDCESPR